MVNKRGEFDIIRKRQAKVGKGKARIAQSTLIVMQAIETNKSNYKFPVTLNDGPIVLPSEEIRLDINDEFTLYEQGFYFRGLLANAEDQSEFATVYLTCAPFELNSANIGYQRLYAGKFSVAVNNIVYMENWDLRQHEYRGITQVQDASAGQPFATWYANSFKENSMVDVLPTITLSGAKKNDLSLTLPDTLLNGGATPFIPTNNGAGNLSLTLTHIVWMGRGYLAQNSSTFQ